MKRSAPPSAATRTTEGGRGRPALSFLLDDFVALLLRESKAERRRWLAAHAREWFRRLPRRAPTVLQEHSSGPGALAAPLAAYQISQGN